MPEPRLLVVRLGSLGDIVHTFPAVAGLRESFPEAEIVWLTHPRWKALVESSELATDVWETETRSFQSLREIIGRIRKAHFTTAIDYQGLWKSPNRIFLANGSRVRRTDPLHRWRPLHTDPHRRSEWRIVAARWCSQGRGVRRPLGAVDSGSVCLATPAKHGYRTVRRIEPRRGLALEMLAAGSLRRSLPENPRHARTAFGSELWPR